MEKRKINKDRYLAGEKLAGNIKTALKKRNWSQRHLAKITRLSPGNVSDILTGRSKRIEWYTLYKIAEALDCTTDSLMAGSEIQIVDNPQYRKIIEAMPPNVKLFFSTLEDIPDSDVEAALKVIDMVIEKHKQKKAKEKKSKK